MKKTENCKICGGNSFELFLKTKDFFYTQDEFELSICSDCNFVFTNPVPENLGKYYETEEYLSHHSESKNLISRIYSLVRNRNIRNKFKIVGKYVSRGTILDIGCGTGEFLAYFKSHGWKTTGVEPDDEARKFAINSNKLSVLKEDEISNITNKSVDVITMWHVLEHVEQLNDRIRQVKRITKDDGIMIFALPNIDSPDARKYGRFWAGLDVPRHLYHFSEITFSSLVKQHGLKIVSSIPMKFDAYYVSMLSEQYKRSSFGKLRAVISGFKSNMSAKKNNNYSSMIFVVKKV